MANGSSFEGPARADRLREKYARMHKRTQDKLDAARELSPYREEQDSVSEVTVGIGERVKVGAKGIPPLALGAALVVLALAAAVVAILRALG